METRISPLAHVDAGRLDQAAAIFARALATEPDAAGAVAAHAGWAAALMRQGRTAQAVTHLERAVALEPGSPANRTDLSSALAASGRFADALREAQIALRIDPSYAPARVNVQRLNAMGYR